MYFCDDNKFSSKGINKKQNEITKQKYVDALNGNATQEFVNNGFRVKNNQMNTYSLTKTGMKLFNDKRFRIGLVILSIQLFRLLQKSSKRLEYMIQRGMIFICISCTRWLESLESLLSILYVPPLL